MNRKFRKFVSFSPVVEVMRDPETAPEIALPLVLIFGGILGLIVGVLFG